MTSLAPILRRETTSVLRVGKLKTEVEDIGTRLSGKGIVLLYFSAHWCPPCRNFTPKLARLYQKLKQMQNDAPPGAATIDFEVVFVSCDRTEQEFEEYYRTMPWTAIPWEQLAVKGGIKEQLSAECQVQGIPSLVILNKHLEIISRDGVNWVLSRDPEGRQFHSGAWLSGNRSIYETLIMGTGVGGTNSPGALAVDSPTAGGGGGLPCFTITNKKTGKVYRTVEDLKQLDSFALYFSAHWCPPCRQFTPQLAATYRNIVSKTESKMEIIFVSWDKNATEAKNYYDSEMPWAAFDYASDSKLIQTLATRCQVKSIPTLVTVNAKTGTVINLSAREVAPIDPEGKLYPWPERLNGGGGGGSAVGMICKCFAVVFIIWMVTRWM